MALNKLGEETVPFFFQLPIRTKGTMARPESGIETEKFAGFWMREKLLLLPVFRVLMSRRYYRPGKGGSDTTAVALAAALGNML